MNRKLLSALSVLLTVLLPGLAAEKKDVAGLAADVELVETRTAVPVLKAAGAYEPVNGIVSVDLSEYAGYAGLIVANGGLEPNEDSYFFKKHKLKLKIMISEEENWSSINSGRIGVSATTTDVLPLFGKQFQVAVPALISYSRGADGIVVASDIKQINNLKGKVLAVSQFNEADFFIRYLAQEAGLDVNMLSDLSAAPHRGKVNLVVCADAFGAGDLFLRDVLAGRNRVHGCVSWGPKTTEVVEQSKGKAKLLVTNKNLLIIADILIVNREFAKKHADIVKALVEGLIAGNSMLRTDSEAHLETVGKAFGWSKEKAAAQLKEVHFANLPENLAFFAGTVDSAGSYGYIYESSAMAYGPQFIRDSYNGEKFVDLSALKAIDGEGNFKDQKAEILPICEQPDAISESPLLAKDVRFLFQPNSNKLALEDKGNIANLERVSKMLQISPGSTITLRGHTDTSMVGIFRKQGGEKLVRKMALKAVQLSKERCDEVKTILAESYRVAASRIETVGCGWNEPLGDDQEQNRRVEVQWFTVK